MLSLSPRNSPHTCGAEPELQLLDGGARRSRETAGRPNRRARKVPPAHLHLSIAGDCIRLTHTIASVPTSSAGTGTTSTTRLGAHSLLLVCHLPFPPDSDLCSLNLHLCLSATFSPYTIPLSPPFRASRDIRGAEAREHGARDLYGPRAASAQRSRACRHASVRPSSVTWRRQGLLEQNTLV